MRPGRRPGRQRTRAAHATLPSRVVFSTWLSSDVVKRLDDLCWRLRIDSRREIIARAVDELIARHDDNGSPTDAALSA